ncbi:MAG: PAS domain S-box protein [bacterium]|nr:PAS domain S-box protein [bacterium]
MSIAVAVLVFAVDPFIPLGVAFGVPYIVAVLLTLWSPRRHDTLLLGVGCSILTVAGYFLSPELGADWQVIFNRGLALFAIWVTTGVCLARKRSEARLKASQALLVERDERMRAILDTAADGIITIDEHGVVRSFNAAAERMFGFHADEILGRNVSLLMPSPYDEEHDEHIERYLWTGESHIIGFGREVVGRRKDGTVFPLDIDIGESQYAGEREFSGILRDLTERKRLEAEYLQAQKMEAVGRLAGGVAHDFNNLLAGILGGLRIAMKELEEEHAAVPMLHEVRQEVARGASITRRLLDFTRTTVPNPRPVDLCDTVHTTEHMMHRLLGEDIELQIDCRTDGSLVRADPGMIEQALLNLVINARDAMPGGGQLVIACREADLSPEDLGRLGSDTEPGPYLLLSVQDDGCGMDEETACKAREAFFTTKEPGMGTGLGLSTVESMAKGWGGFLELRSTVGEGTEVRLYLPRTDALEEAEPSIAGAPSSEEIAATGGTILVVEDEKLVRLGIQHMLQELGYVVRTAKDPFEALEELRAARGSRIDLLLTDVVLPGMSGPELVETVREIAPQLPSLFMSAFPQAELVAQGRIEAGTPTIEKPFGQQDVSEKVRAALARPCPPDSDG